MDKFRIVSLVPSLTETLCDLGLQDQVVGVTSFCTHPVGLAKKVAVVGGTKDPKIEQINELKPTHVVVNKEENKPEHIEQLKSICEVVETDISKVSQVLELYKTLGEVFSVSRQAGARSAKLEELFRLLDLHRRTHPNEEKIKALYFIWKDPWMVVSKDTYISDALSYFGIENPVDPVASLGEAGRYPEIDQDAYVGLGTNVCLFSTEPWPFRKRDVQVFRESIERNCEAYKVDGKMFSWYGKSTRELLEKALFFHEQGLKMFDKFD